MIPLTYIPFRWRFTLIILPLIFFILPKSLAIFLIFLMGLGVWCFRRKYPLDFSVRTVGIYAPAHGKVVSIGTEIEHDYLTGKFHLVVVDVSKVGPFGMYFPISGEVEKVFHCQEVRDEEGNALKDSGLFLKINGKEWGSVGIDMRKNSFNMYPQLWPAPGDFGHKGVDFGYFPFGGKIELYIPIENDIIVTVDEQLDGSKTLVASQGRYNG